MLAASDVLVAQNVGFAVIALVMVVFAIRVVTSNNVVHAALSLVMVMAGAAAVYILLAAEFVAEGLAGEDVGAAGARVARSEARVDEGDEEVASPRQDPRQDA